MGVLQGLGNLGQTNIHQDTEVGGKAFSSSDIISQSAIVIKNAKLKLQQSLQTGLTNSEVQNLGADYLDEQVSNLENVFNQLNLIQNEKAVNGILTSKSIERLVKTTEEIKQEKNRLSEKLLSAENDGNISGDTLAKMKQTAQTLVNTEMTLQKFLDTLNISHRPGQQILQESDT